MNILILVSATMFEVCFCISGVSHQPEHQQQPDQKQQTVRMQISVMQFGLLQAWAPAQVAKWVDVPIL